MCPHFVACKHSLYAYEISRSIWLRFPPSFLPSFSMFYLLFLFCSISPILQISYIKLFCIPSFFASHLLVALQTLCCGWLAVLARSNRKRRTGQLFFPPNPSFGLAKQMIRDYVSKLSQNSRFIFIPRLPPILKTKMILPKCWISWVSWLMIFSNARFPSGSQIRDKFEILISFISLQWRWF